jgi:porin
MRAGVAPARQSSRPKGKLPEVSDGFTSGCAARIAGLALALVVGWAEPSAADDVAPANDVPVPEPAAPAPETGSHEHVYEPGPRETVRDALRGIWNRDKLTGDWRGLRSDLSEHGIDFGLRLSQYYQGVASGGVDRDSEYGGTMDYRVSVDAGKLFGAKGLSFNMHARTRFGEDINADAGALVLPNAGMLMPAPGDYHGTDITGLTASYTFPVFAGRLANVSAGKFDVIDLVTGFFPDIGDGQEGFWNVNAMVSAMPYFGAVQGLSLYGGMAMTIHPKWQHPESGALAVGTANVSTSWGSLSDSFGDGVYVAGFQRLFWDLDDKMGYFMVYASGSTREQASNDPHDFVEIPGQGIVSTKEKEPWNVALYVYQDFWQAQGDPKRKANFIIGGTVGPDDPQFAQWNVFANVEVFGLFASRPHDRMGVGGWWNGLSSNFKDLTSPVADLDDTWGFEMYYNLEMTPWAHLSADLQLVQNQNNGDDLAVIPGIRAVIDF